MRKRRLAIPLLLIAVLTAQFFGNILGTSPHALFSTARDGSEALVVGRIFADVEGLELGRNVGWVEIDEITERPDIFAVYRRLEEPGTVTPLDLTDAEWERGVSREEAAFLLPRARYLHIGYAQNEVQPGQIVTLPSGETREVLRTVVSERTIEVHLSGPPLDPDEVAAPARIVVPEPSYVTYGYASQFGLEGILFSALFAPLDRIGQVVSFAGLDALHFLNAVFFSVVLVLLARQYALIHSFGFAATFLVCIAASPWLVGLGRNLYWIPALWFLPAVCAAVAFRARSRLWRFLGLGGHAAAIFVKSLSGYEYLSSIVMLAAIPILVDAFAERPRHERRSLAGFAMLFGVATLAGFGAALLLHTHAFFGSFQVGLNEILAPERHRSAREAIAPLGIIDVLRPYFLDWESEVLPGLGGSDAFVGLVAAALAGLAVMWWTRDPNRRRDSALLAASATVPLSWFLLMKGHSVVHIYLNFVLWYLSFIPAAVYCVLRGIEALLIGSQFWAILRRKFRANRAGRAILALGPGRCAGPGPLRALDEAQSGSGSERSRSAQ